MSASVWQLCCWLTEGCRHNAIRDTNNQHLIRSVHVPFDLVAVQSLPASALPSRCPPVSEVLFGQDTTATTKGMLFRMSFCQLPHISELF